MNKINQILLDFDNIIANPNAAIKNYIDGTGKKAVGCFPVYAPEEIIYAAGMLPVGMWGGQTNISKADKYLQSFCCSIMRANLEQGMSGMYNDLSAVIIPTFCDTLKCMCENWKTAVPQTKHMGIVYPQNRNLKAGIDFLSDEYRKIIDELSEISGKEITDEDFEESIKIYNEYRKTMREFTTLIKCYSNTITPKIRHHVIKASYFMDKKVYTTKIKELIKELSKMPKEKNDHSKVVITGIIAEPDSFLELFEEVGIGIVADDLAQESRQYRGDISENTGDPIKRIAARIVEMGGCSLLYDNKKQRGQMLVDLVKENEADGLIVCMLKFCDPEEFDYPIYKLELEKEDIPYLYMEIEQYMNSVEQLRTRLQSFSELLQM